VVDGKPVLKAEAWGGAAPVPGFTYRVMSPRQTTPGRYVIHSYGAYTTRTWESSKIAWGTKLTVDHSVHPPRLMYETSLQNPRWRPVTDLVPWATLSRVMAEFASLFGPNRRYDRDGDGIPDVWVFNDFGAKAVRCYRDKNHNKKLDAGESLMGEMFHTTPENEAQAGTGRPVVLEESHGCIHISPERRDRLHAADAFARGTDFIVHPYTEQLAPAWR
jgi:hypothetical protein